MEISAKTGMNINNAFYNITELILNRVRIDKILFEFF